MLCVDEALPFNNIIAEEEYIASLQLKGHFELRWENFFDKLLNPCPFMITN